MGVNIGLDFGTSNSGVAIYDGQNVKLLPIDPGNVVPEVTRTILYITRNYQYFIGQEAIELYYRHNVDRLRRYVKKWAGEIEYRGADMYYVRDVYVDVDELQPGRLLQYLKTALRKQDNNQTYRGTQIFERYYQLVDLLQIYLVTLKHRAEEILEQDITGVTLGRPVKFSENTEQDSYAEQVLLRAAVTAGFEKVNLEYEPVAAALYYEKSLHTPQNAVIFDFGGGTLDIAVMRLGDPQNRKLFASGGIGIAGSDFDRAIIEKRLLQHFGLGKISYHPELIELIKAVPDWSAIPGISTPQIRNRLEKAIEENIAPVQLKRLQALIYNDLAFSFYNQVEAAKIQLSSQGASLIELSNIQIDFWELYTRLQFEKDILDFQLQIENALLDTVSASGFDFQEIDVVVTTGGSSNIPAFTLMLERIFGPSKIIHSNTFSSVVSGLAIRAYENR